jgi:hypothetical protein
MTSEFSVLSALARRFATIQNKTENQLPLLTPVGATGTA